MIITIDGPTGSGKTTVADRVSKRLGINHLKGGIFLRSLTFFCLKNSLSEKAEIVSALSSIELLLLKEKVDGSGASLELNGEKLSDNQLWNENVDAFVSYVAGIQEVREARKAWLRMQVIGSDFVADGRTLGSEIFPDADYKFVLTCDLNERARRRAAQGGYSNNIERISDQIAERDLEDSKGSVDRTVFSAEALIIDSTDLVIDQVVEIICKHVNT